MFDKILRKSAMIAAEAGQHRKVGNREKNCQPCGLRNAAISDYMYTEPKDL